MSRVRFGDAQDGWIFGPGLFGTHDGGSTWKPVTVPGAPARSRVVSLAAGNGYAFLLVVPPAGTAGAGEVFRTGLGADNWAPAGLTVPQADNGLVLVQGTSTWVVVVTTQGQTVLEALTSSGWQKQSVPCTTTTLAWGATSSTLGAVCGGGGAAGSEVKAVYVSADAGASFRQAGQAPSGGDIGGFAMASPTTMVVSAASGASWLYASFDGGATWSTVLTDTGSGGMPWYDLGFTSTTLGEVVEGDPAVRGMPSSRLFVTDDGGRTWQPVSF